MKVTIFKDFSDFLKSNRSDYVKRIDVLVENWSPTYGAGDPTTETLDIIEFDALCKAMDDFSKEFK